MDDLRELDRLADEADPLRLTDVFFVLRRPLISGPPPGEPPGVPLPAGRPFGLRKAARSTVFETGHFPGACTALQGGPNGNSRL